MCIRDSPPNSHLVAEVLDLVEHLPDVRHHILALHHNVLVAASARRDVQHRAVLGAVDVLAAEHRVDLLLQLRCARQVVQQLPGRRVHAGGGEEGVNSVRALSRSEGRGPGIAIFGGGRGGAKKGEVVMRVGPG
eukprot:364379-Chlamydomonas_euryale.AAC.10